MIMNWKPTVVAGTDIKPGESKRGRTNPVSSEPQEEVPNQVDWRTREHIREDIALGRQEGDKGIFQALSEGALPDRGRKLAASAIAKLRIHYEAAARADREGDGDR